MLLGSDENIRVFQFLRRKADSVTDDWQGAIPVSLGRWNLAPLLWPRRATPPPTLPASIDCRRTADGYDLGDQAPRCASCAKCCRLPRARTSDPIPGRGWPAP